MKVWVVFTVPEHEGQEKEITSVVDSEEKAFRLLRAYKGSPCLGYGDYEVE